MSAVVYWMVWTYAALVLGWWCGRHWDCVHACSRCCVSDRRVDRGLIGRLESQVDAQRARDVLRHADTVGGYPSSGRDVSDLAPPPAGPGTGGSRP